MEHRCKTDSGDYWETEDQTVNKKGVFSGSTYADPWRLDIHWEDQETRDGRPRYVSVYHKASLSTINFPKPIEPDEPAQKPGLSVSILGLEPSIEPGGSEDVGGSVTVNVDGVTKNVGGATVQYETNVPGASKGQVTADSSGYYSLTFTIPEDAPEKDYTLTVTAKSEGYADGSNERTFTVKKPTSKKQVGFGYPGGNLGIGLTVAGVLAISALGFSRLRGSLFLLSRAHIKCSFVLTNPARACTFESR